MLAWVLLAVSLALLVAAFSWIGAPVIGKYMRDAPMYLDGAWRIVNGQTPHKDFYVYFGDLPFYVAWLGMKLGHPGIAALTYGNIFVMLGAGLAAMAILRRRTSALYACLFSLFIALLAVAPRALGSPYYCECYAMIYNRYGEAFLALLGAILFLPPDPALPRSWRDWVETAFAGFCLVLLLFSKLNYFVVGAGFFAISCLRGWPAFKQALFGLLSACFFFALALTLTKIPLSAMWGDFRIMLAAQNAHSRALGLASLCRQYLLFLPIFWLMVWEISRNKKEPRTAWLHFILVTAIFGSELLLVATNTQLGDLPLLALAALYIAETIRRQTLDASDKGLVIALRNAVAALLFLACLIPVFFADLSSISHSASMLARGRFVTPKTLTSTRLADFRFPPLNYTIAEFAPTQVKFTETMDEGIALLRRHSDPAMRLAVFLFSNPYQVALGLPPAEGGAIAWSLAGINQRSHPPLKRLVGDATHILASGGPDIGNGMGDGFKAAYGAQWDDLHLEIVEQTEHLTLFKVPSNKP